MQPCLDDCCRPEREEFTYTVLSHTSPAARKEHTCDDCGRPIRVGQRYVREVAVVNNNELRTRKHHSVMCPDGGQPWPTPSDSPTAGPSF